MSKHLLLNQWKTLMTSINSVSNNFMCHADTTQTSATKKVSPKSHYGARFLRNNGQNTQCVTYVIIVSSRLRLSSMPDIRYIQSTDDLHDGKCFITNKQQFYVRRKNEGSVLFAHFYLEHYSIEQIKGRL